MQAAQQTETQESITLEKFERLCIELFKQRAVVDEASEKHKIETNKMEELKSKILSFMEQNEKDKYPVKGHGLIYTVDRFTVPTPKSTDDKKKFFGYLEKKGIFLEMASVNSATLNSFYKTEMEIAIAKGNVDFAIPGIGEPSHVRTINLRKG